MPPVNADDFDANPIAHLRYAALLPAAEARAIFEAQAASEVWRKHPQEWLEEGGRRARRDDSPWPNNAFYEWAAMVLLSSTLDHDLGPMLHEVTGKLLRHSPDGTDLVGRIVEWFLTQATPGHAPICASLLRGPSTLALGPDAPASHIPRVLFPLVEWLLMNGAAELRATEPPEPSSGRNPPAPKHADLLPRLVETVDENGRLDLLEIALRYVLLARVPGCGWNSLRSRGLWPQIERALERGASESLATDVVQRIGLLQAPSKEQIWAPFNEPALFPRARLALLRGLGDGLWTGNLFQDGWRAAFHQPPPSQLPPFHDRHALVGAVEQLDFFVVFPETKRKRVPELAAWAERLLDEVVRFFGPDGLSILPLDHLHPFDRLLGKREEITLAVERCLERALAAAPPSAPVKLARAIMAHEAVDHLSRIGRGRAALAALWPSTQSKPRIHASLTPLEAKLTQLISYPWTERHHGVRIGSLLGSRRRISFERLANDDKVRLDADRIVLEPDFYEQVLSEPRDSESAMALCVLYFLHELIHLQQGIGRFSTVQTVRSTGAEMTLMHIDLGADHAACLLANTAFPRWDVAWLKDLTGRSLTAFPASSFHTQAARHRKAARLVSIRLDYLGRTLGAVSSHDLDDGYLFADYGPAGGHLLILTSASPLSLIKAAPLSPADVNVLWNAAEPSRNLDEVDEILRLALRHEG